MTREELEQENEQLRKELAAARRLLDTTFEIDTVGDLQCRFMEAMTRVKDLEHKLYQIRTSNRSSRRERMLRFFGLGGK